MFAIFINGSFYSLWQNKKTDVFIPATLAFLKNLAGQSGSYAINFYEGLESAPELFTFDGSNNLVVQKIQIDIVNELEVSSVVTDYQIDKEEIQTGTL